MTSLMLYNVMFNGMLWWTLCYFHCFDSLDLGLGSTLLTNEMRDEMTTNHKMVSQPAIRYSEKNRK